MNNDYRTRFAVRGPTLRPVPLANGEVAGFTSELAQRLGAGHISGVFPHANCLDFFSPWPKWPAHPRPGVRRKHNGIRNQIEGIELKWNPETEWITVKNTHDTLISIESFKTVQ